MNSLATIAVDINRAHECCLLAAADAVTHAINAGRMLTEVKASLPHGQFVAWIEQNCRFSRVTANTYIRVSNVKRDLHLNPPESIRHALRMLTDEAHPDDEPSLFPDAEDEPKGDPGDEDDESDESTPDEEEEEAEAEPAHAQSNGTATIPARETNPRTTQANIFEHWVTKIGNILNTVQADKGGFGWGGLADAVKQMKREQWRQARYDIPLWIETLDEWIGELDKHPKESQWKRS